MGVIARVIVGVIVGGCGESREESHRKGVKKHGEDGRRRLE